MPILHTVMLFLLYGQMQFYLNLNSSISKFVQLFWRALSDVTSFIIIEFILVCLMSTVMQVQGVRFDDGGNFILNDVDEDKNYDSSHNDYPLVYSVGVSILSVLRSAFGDLQMPTYDYWTDKYLAEKQEGKSGFYPQYMIF